ncbi:MAG: HlyC/CorC family transporter [Deltaproteobacteria bacterium]|nr:HlyC/CorC family transporter [Deltaproteobacteria bacterium]
MTEKLLLTALFVFLNGFFVAAEFALVKTRPSRVEALASRGDKRAERLRKILEQLDLYLSGCQLGITIASLVLGYLAEPAFAALIEQAAVGLGLATEAQLAEPALNPLLHYTAFGLALTVVTILHMVLGEQAPKIWAIQSGEKAAMRFAFPLWLFTTVLRPLIVVVNVMSNALLRLMGVAGGHGEHATDARELKGIIAAAASAGNISNRQRMLAENILDLVDMEVRHVMVPRTDVSFLDLSEGASANLESIATLRHSRWPVCEPDLDHVVGMLLVRDLFDQLTASAREHAEVDLRALSREPLFVPDTQPLSRFIADAQRTGQHGALVLDEHGTVVGMVFLEDALEEIVGPLHDERDTVRPLVVEKEEGVIEMAGSVDLPEAATLLELDDYDDSVDTVGGLVTAILGRLPKPGDEVRVGHYDATVVSIQRRRIQLIRFTPVAPPPED